ncbi:uncharacterized protein LOC121262410 isoform X2 [Juglans microcarpa x Juglans regia]|uniref:uncharacterized protein LOC121262410 isoform X2 n=1 Tax=Juglans microcarpa x Juglans regia TaxID=2249226 RepID=UPI001B7DD8C0|nr:uncharacterized protein LOC121262410 isoform X2 [Juglans microcarpa x Juglans regia]
MEIVTAVAAKIAEVIVVPVGQWLCYACHYKSNMKNLKNQVKKLQNAKDKVQHTVKIASDNGDEIEVDVKTWLTEVDGIIDQFGGGEEEAESRNSNVSWLNLKQRHQISREAKEMVDNIAELLKMANFDRVSRRPAAQEMVTPRNVDYMTLDSRISITKRIMEALGDANINKIGVWGSPGVGKSTLMKEIFRKAKEESLFDEVALANVTESPNLSQIQEEIANMLDLKLDPNCKTEMVRAGHLRARLEKDKEKKILVILDDIWKRLDLEEIGIIPSDRCKVLLTSRDRHVLASEMVTEENSFKLDTLGGEEAWNLFEKMAGDFVKDDLDLRHTAIEVARACGGLPIALVTVSRALKNKNLRIWKDALVQLTRPTAEHDTDIWLPVYTCIQLSYKHLVGRELKSLFLLCAQQGYYISYRDLLRYGFGLCLFRGIDTLDEARNRLENLVSKLQDACLLLQSPHSSEKFYMHDLVRHVATIIASNDDHNMSVMRGDGGQKAWPDVDSLKRCEALSIHGGDHIHKYSNEMECPKLRYFHVQCKGQSMEIPNISFHGMDKLEDIFFQGMEKLEVLSLKNIQLSSLLPLTNLRTLCLDGCKLGDIHWIEELKTLVILSLARSDISNLPGEIGSLTSLRLLDLNNCFKLRVIPPNVLSSLVNLEELYMRDINVQWEVEGPNNEGKNASLAELKKLSHLITLEIDIKDANNLPKDLFSEKLERYKIRIGDCQHGYLIFSKATFSRKLELKLNMSSFQLNFGIKMLLKRTEYLYLDESNSTKSVLYELDREDFQQLKHLHIQNNCNIMHLPGLRTSFQNLKVLRVDDCEKLRFIFSSSIARGLSLLEELKITRCKNVGAIFVKEEEDGIEEVFCRLQTLVLMDLPKLMSFLSTRETNSEGNDHDLQVPLLHHQLSFPSLKTLDLNGLPRIKHLWSNVARCENLKSLFLAAAVATSLTQLKSLEITDCGVLEEIVQREDGTDPTTRILFTSLTLPRLDALPKLKWFFQGVRTLESSSSKELHEQGGTLFEVDELSFLSLETLHLAGLPRIKHVWSKEISRFQDLLHLRVARCENLKSLFLAAAVATSLTQLKSLEITDCGVLEEIVQREDGTDPTTRILFTSLTLLRLDALPKLKWFFQGVHNLESSSSKELHEQGGTLFGVDEVAFPNLTTLHLGNLPKIKHVWSKDPQTILRFQNLQNIDVWKCASLNSLFPALIGTCLKQLKEIRIKDCGVLEEIVEVEGGEAVERRLVFEFPQVTSLVLKNLSRLECFYKGVHISKWPMLKAMEIGRCKKVEVLFASGLVSKETVEERQSQSSIKQPLFWVDEMPFPSLERFEISKMEKLEIIWNIKDSHQRNMYSFPNLLHIDVSLCESLKSLFPTASVAASLEKLESLEIRDCGVLEEIVQREDGTDPTTTILFTSLTLLRLDALPKLKWFFQGVRTLESSSSKELHEQGGTLFGVDELSFPSLKTLQLAGLPKIKHVWSKETVEERQYSQMSIKQPLFWVDKRPVPSLEILKISKMEKLEIIWNIKDSHQRDMYNFPKLLHIDVSLCESLKSLFPTASIAASLQELQSLIITGCGVLEEIVEREDGTDPTTRLSFPNLICLGLYGLPKLKWFFQGVHTLESSSSKELHEQGGTLFVVEELSFPSLKTLQLAGLPKIKHVWSNVARCENLKSLFPAATVATSLTQLKSLKIRDCGVLEEIVQREDGTDPTTRILFTNLTSLSLDGLPKLKWFFQGVHTLESSSSKELHEQGGTLFGVNELSFPSLKTLQLAGLPKIKHVWSKEIFRFPDLFNLHVARCENLKSLTQLKSLKIRDCGVLEEIVQREDGTDPTTRILFTSLTSLSLDGLPKLKWFFQGVHTLESSSSKELHEQGGTLFGVNEVAFPKLTNLDLYGLPKIKHVWSKETVEERQYSQMSIKQPLFWVDKRPVSSLEILKISKMEKLEIIWNIKDSHQRDMYNFPKLLHIDVSLCESLKSLFPTASVAASLQELQSLIITGCGVLEEIVEREDGTDPTTRLSFPNLICLGLYGLPKLKWFFQGVHTLELSSSKELHEQGGTLFVVEEVGFPSLKLLDLYGLPKIKHVWSKDSQTIPSFQNLQVIIVGKCVSLKSLFPASIVRYLEQLEKIKIYDCGVEEIVAAEEGEAAEMTLVFPQVTSLCLENLERLEGVHDSKWSMLKEKRNLECKKVKVRRYKLFSSIKIFTFR